jgi:hypothetical protein
MLSSQGAKRREVSRTKVCGCVCGYADAAAGDLKPSCPSWKREISKPLNTGQIAGPRHILLIVVSIESGKLTKSG